MDEEFAFTPTVKENREALQAISRSMTNQTIGSVRGTLACLVMYGFPFIVAVIFFRNSLEEIYLTFLVFIVTVMTISRFGPRAASMIAERLAVPQTVRLSSTGVAQDGDHAHVHWRWDSLNRVHVFPAVLVLEFRDWSWVPLPNRLWPGDQLKRKFVEELRGRAPNVLPDLPSASVPTPFTLINVGAGFAAAELFLLQIFGVTAALLMPSRWPAAIHYAQQNVPQAIGLMFAASLSVAIVGFFGVRYALRRLEQRHPRTAACLSAMFIGLFVALVIASFMYRHCGC
jgi:hypothetical protein